jgi:outer membrane protein
VNVLRARNAARTARLRLAVRMGVEPVPDLDVVLTTRFEVVPLERTDAELYSQAIERNPALAALRATERASDYSTRVARSRYLPTLSISAGIGGFTRRASSTGFLIAQAEGQAQLQIQQCQVQNDFFSRLADPLPPMNCQLLQMNDARRQAIADQNNLFPFDFTRQPTQASLTVSLPIFQGFSRRRQLQAANVERDNVRLRVREQEIQLRADISAGLAAVRTAWESARIEERNQQVADDQLRLAREQYAVGSASFLQLVEAETVKAVADRDRFASVHSYHEALANLEAVVGTSLRNP